ncbi:uncharacterized protein At3g28850-like [Cucurbita pepo subsp. pepo]|uniref:uncharacterized protein At3g28850-like n=1 Tax=Cucurbita pepo subsp. pepo TaxID=3664 RepID=UPI000C9D7D2D|nr:uncharacterized protein At3g28850-like [Cucurbita pepo subsp. pepo]
MNGVRGKFMKKLKSMKPPIAYLKQDRILQVIAPNGYSDFFTRSENLEANVQKSNHKNGINLLKENRDFAIEDEETEESGFAVEDKENIEPSGKSNGGIGDSLCLRAGNCLPESKRETPLSEIDISSFRRPDMNSGSLFDPNLLEVFHQAVMEYMKIREAEIKCGIEIEEHEEEEEEEEEEKQSSSEIPLFMFEEKCPPGGSDSVILYTTTLRGIRKTFEECNSIRFLLETFRVKFFERDVSMHTEFKEELWRVLGTKRALPPKLFIRGRYIGGAEEVLGLHEQGKLRPLFDGVPIDCFAGIPCEGCGGVRFVLCFNCNGSKRVVDESDEQRNCPECNENGLILCPYCC